MSESNQSTQTVPSAAPVGGEAAIKVRDVAKHFGDTMALDGVTLEVKTGSIYGLLGPNGAGKTTLVRILTTLLQPDRGAAQVAGIDVLAHPEEVRRVIGLAGQYAAVDENLTGRENLEMVGQLYHLPRPEAKKRAVEILERLGLSEAADRPSKTYSGGMRRKLDLGATFITNPPVLLMDEPTTGLDPRARFELWDVIRELVKGGTTLMLTTQYLEEADELCDRIAVIDHGHLIAEGTTDELKAQLGGGVIEIEVAGDKQRAITALEQALGERPKQHDNHLVVPASRGPQSLTDAVRALDAAGVTVTDLHLRKPSLDEVFLSLTGGPTNGQN